VFRTNGIGDLHDFFCVFNTKEQPSFKCIAMFW
jgi:hypothetical protein